MSEAERTEKRKGKRAVQWTYLLTSAIIILSLMIVVGYLNVRNLEENYKKSFFESSQAVSKGGIQTIEHGLKYGKNMGTFYKATAVANEIQEYISSSDNVTIIAPDGGLFVSVFPKKALSQETYRSLLGELDRAQISQFGAQVVFRDGFYYEFLPILGKDGANSAYLVISFDDAILRSKTLGFTQSSGLTVLVVTLLGTALFMLILSRVRATNDRGEVRRMLLMSIMIANITLCQLEFLEK